MSSTNAPIRHTKTSKARSSFIHQTSFSESNQAAAYRYKTRVVGRSNSSSSNNNVQLLKLVHITPPEIEQFTSPTQQCEKLINKLNQSISKLQGQINELERRLDNLLSDVANRISRMESAQEKEVANERLLLSTLEREADLSMTQLHRLRMKEKNLLVDIDDLERQNQLVNQEIEQHNYYVFKKGQMASFMELEDEFEDLEEYGTTSEKGSKEKLMNELEVCEKNLYEWQEFQPEQPSDEELNPFIINHIQDAVFQLVLNSRDSKKEHIYDAALSQLKSLYNIPVGS